VQLSKELLIRLKMAKGIGNQSIWQIVKAFENIKNNFKLTAEEIAKLARLNKTKQQFVTSFNAISEQEIEKILKTHKFFTIYDDAYPTLLREIYNAPTVLFYSGDLSLIKKKAISFVGSRTATLIGLNSCRKLIEELPKSLVIVSGGAKGIDTMSHESAISCKKRTISIIGSGLNVNYPKENQKLFQHLKKDELVLSEYLNDELPLRHHFPERNRIIAGISMGTVVIEAKERSGSLITCERALEEGREIFAVPSEILSNNSNGCHKLIQQGAKCVYQATDIISEVLI